MKQLKRVLGALTACWLACSPVLADEDTARVSLSVNNGGGVRMEMVRTADVDDKTYDQIETAAQAKKAAARLAEKDWGNVQTIELDSSGQAQVEVEDGIWLFMPETDKLVMSPFLVKVTGDMEVHPKAETPRKNVPTSAGTGLAASALVAAVSAGLLVWMHKKSRT